MLAGESLYQQTYSEVDVFSKGSTYINRIPVFVDYYTTFSFGTNSIYAVLVVV